MQASFTGGSPGTPTYGWALIAPNHPGASFQNPSNASSQLVRLPNVPVGASQQGVRVTVTDAQGHTSTQGAIATATHNTTA